MAKTLTTSPEIQLKCAGCQNPINITEYHPKVGHCPICEPWKNYNKPKRKTHRNPLQIKTNFATKPTPQQPNKERTMLENKVTGTRTVTTLECAGCHQKIDDKQYWANLSYCLICADCLDSANEERGLKGPGVQKDDPFEHQPPLHKLDEDRLVLGIHIIENTANQQRERLGDSLGNRNYAPLFPAHETLALMTAARKRIIATKAEREEQ